jgi:hypothetical protein
MTNAKDQNGYRFIVNFANHSIIADTVNSIFQARTFLHFVYA